MKSKQKTFVGTILSVAALIAGGILVRRAVKREEKRLYAEEKKQNSEIESLGVPAERMRSQVIECEREADRNMVKALYVGIESSPEWEEGIIDTTKCLEAEAMVHVTEETGYNGIKYLAFLFEIPDLSNSKGYNNPRIGDYYTAMRQLKEYLWSKVVVYCKEPIGRMSVYVAYSYMDPREGLSEPTKISEVLEVPKSVWSKWADEHDGAVEFYMDASKRSVVDACKDKGVWGELAAAIAADIEKKNPNSELSVTPFMEEVRLMYKISFREATRSGDFGIDVKSALIALKYITDDFSVNRKGSDKTGYVYEQIMFHAPNEDGEFDSLTRFYANKGGKIVHDTYSYPVEEDDADYSATNNVFNIAKHAAMEKHEVKK